MARGETDMRRRLEWISAPDGELAVLHLGDEGRESTWLLADTPGGLRVFAPQIWTRIESIVRTEHELGRRRTGPWLVYRESDQQWPVQTVGIRLTPGEGGTLGAREYVRPRRRLRHDLTRARSRPVGEQLTACDLYRLPVADRTESVTWYMPADDPQILLVHRIGTSAVAICSGTDLVHWDSTLVPTDAPTSRPPADDSPPRRAMHERPSTSWRQVEAPRGLGRIRGRPSERAPGFRGGIRDLDVIHERCADEERGTADGQVRPWSYPTPHFHTRDGGVVCTRSDGYAADEQNLPWREWERAVQEYQSRAVEYWTSHPSTGHL